MTAITRFEDIEAWKTSRQLTNSIYAHTNQTGFNRDFGLRDQIRRASISVMSNIAEGFESRTDSQFINFLEWRALRLAKSGRNFILPLTKITSQKNNSMILFPRRRRVPVRSQISSNTLKQIPDNGVYLTMALITIHNLFDFRLLTFDKLK